MQFTKCVSTVVNPFFKCSPYNYKLILSRFVEVVNVGRDVFDIIMKFLCGSELFGPIAAKLPQQCVMCNMNHEYANKCIKMIASLKPLSTHPVEKYNHYSIHRYFELPQLPEMEFQFKSRHPLTHRAFGNTLFQVKHVGWGIETTDWHIAKVCLAVVGGNLDYPMLMSGVFDGFNYPCLGIFTDSTALWNEAVNEAHKQVTFWFVEWLFELCTSYKYPPLQAAFDDLINPLASTIRTQSVRALNLNAYTYFAHRYRKVNCSKALKKYIELVWE